MIRLITFVILLLIGGVAATHRLDYMGTVGVCKDGNIETSEADLREKFGGSRRIDYGRLYKNAATPLDFKDKPNAEAISLEKRSELKEIFEQSFLPRKIDWNKSYRQDSTYYLWAKSMKTPCAYILKVTPKGKSRFFIQPLRYQWKAGIMRIWEGYYWDKGEI